MNPANGIVSVQSRHTVDDTVAALHRALDAKGIKLFAVIDHSGEARAAGLDMRPTRLLIFGNPRGGTPLMVAAPSIALDLPLRILVAEDAEGNVWMSYNAPEFLRERHGLPKELAGPLATVEALTSMI